MADSWIERRNEHSDEFRQGYLAGRRSMQERVRELDEILHLIRKVLGTTEYVLLMQRVADARAALAKAEKP